MAPLPMAVKMTYGPSRFSWETSVFSFVSTLILLPVCNHEQCAGSPLNAFERQTEVLRIERGKAFV